MFPPTKDMFLQPPVLPPQANHDEISHPHHYTHGGGIEPIDFIMSNKMEFPEASIVKYASRHPHKGKAKDVLKIIQYAQFILDKTYGVKSAFTTLD